MQNKQNGFLQTLRLSLIAGFLGGMAEVMFMLVYARLTTADPIVIGSEITRSFFHAYSIGWRAALLGLAIHFVLSFIMAGFFITVVMAFFKRAWRRKTSLITLGLAYLAAIWSLNFLILLPSVNVAFVHLSPLLVTLTSKLLFGYSMSAYLANRVDDSPVALV